jgi:hypothetical protein
MLEKEMHFPCEHRKYTSPQQKKKPHQLTSKVRNIIPQTQTVMCIEFWSLPDEPRNLQTTKV